MMWPYLDPDRARADLDRTAEQLRVTMLHIDALKDARRAARDDLADMHAERHEARTLQAQIDAARQERMLAEIAEIEEREREVRAELDAAHARAVGDRTRPATLEQAQRHLDQSRDRERQAREALQHTHQMLFRNTRNRARATWTGAITVPVGLVIGVSTGNWPGAIGYLAIMLIASVLMIRFFDREISYAQATRLTRVHDYDDALHQLLLAEAGVMALGGDPHPA